MVSDFFSIYIYFALVAFVTLIVLGISALFPARTESPSKYLPYESGIQTKANLQQERFVIRHYLVALLFLVFDIEVIFLYPWAVISKSLGPFAFYEMLFFLIALLVGFAYVWRKGGLEWEQ
jgi:NADH-quinone oxidoreductase subunit A